MWYGWIRIGYLILVYILYNLCSQYRANDSQYLAWRASRLYIDILCWADCLLSVNCLNDISIFIPVKFYITVHEILFFTIDAGRFSFALFNQFILVCYIWRIVFSLFSFNTTTFFTDIWEVPAYILLDIVPTNDHNIKSIGNTLDDSIFSYYLFGFWLYKQNCVYTQKFDLLK